jgi:tRNA U34 5-methylaminomethyl-2-thiouridine-forming methyltransferase MnmC
MQRKIINTKDNSKTLLIPKMNETYHSTNGAFTEALHIYINQGISQFKSTKNRISIFEMGFGTGLNALLTYQFASQNNLNIDYQTIEKFPITINEIKELNYTKDLKLSQLNNVYNQMHQLPNTKTHNLLDSFSFAKYHNDIKLFKLPLNSIDLIYFDAFAPQHQPDLWTEEILLKMFKALKQGGFLITYCAQGKFKRSLKTVGFTIKGLDGPPGKREITKAIKM